MKPMKLGVILLALLLAAMAMVPCVSAADSPDEQKGLSTVEKQQIMPLDYNATPIEPVDDSEIISIILPEKILNDNLNRKNPKMVDIRIPEDQIGSYIVKDEKNPNLVQFSGIVPDERVAVLRIPKSLFEYQNPDPKEFRINFPLDRFRIYSDKDEAFKEMGKAKISRASTSGENLGFVDVNPMAPLSENYVWHGAREKYFINNANPTNWVTGKITPGSYSNSGSYYVIWQEREIFLDGTDDTIEFLVEYNDNARSNTIRMYPVIYDNDHYTRPGEHGLTSGYINVPRTSLPHEYEFYCIINERATGVYEMWYHDVSSDSWYSYFYTDSSPSQSIDYIAGSSELYLDTNSIPSQYSFNAQTTPIRDEWNVDTSENWQTPAATYQYYAPDHRTDTYVSVSASFVGSLLDTNLYCVE